MGAAMSENATIYENIARLENGGGGIRANYADLVGCYEGEEGDEGVNVFNNLPTNIDW